MAEKKYLDLTGLQIFWNKIKTALSGKLDVNGNSYRTSSIPYAQVDSTSTATAYTATVLGITELRDGVAVMLENGVVTSAAGFTININNLGAKPAYTNMAAATAETTIFNVNYTMLFVYDSTRGDSGGWICYRGYDSNQNTIGYQLRTNSALRVAADKGYRYRLWFQTLDGTYAPANLSTSTNTTSARTPNPRAINPFGEIVYMGTTTAVNAGANLSATTTWSQYTIALGYSFNTTGAALTLTNPAPVYLKCTPVASGGATMDEIVQALPSTEDGKIYIYLGQAYNATNIELVSYHPVYEFKAGKIRLYTGADDIEAIEAPSSPVSGNVLTYNGSSWVAAAAPVTSVNGSTGAVTLTIPSVASDVGAIATPSNPSSGDVLTYNGSAWTATAAPVTSVNGNTGAVVLDAADVGAEGEALVVTYTLGSTVTCDKTYSEIMTALQAKRPIRAYGVQGGFVAAALTTVAAGLAIVFTLPTGATTAIRIVHLSDDTINYQEETAISEVTVSTAGAVTQALDAGKIYHFTGALTNLTITFNAASGVPAQYHFDFTEGSTAFDPVLPNSVVLPDNWAWEADTRYEVDVLNNYAVIVGWAVSV